MKQVYILANPAIRHNAAKAVMAAPDGYAVTIAEPKRSLEQNAMLWKLLNTTAEQVEWHGRWLSDEQWKHIFTASLKAQEVVPGIDGGFVVLGQSTSKMSKRELSDLIELISAFLAQRGINDGHV